jgi:catechol 2,3-dioxygenase-like lactoylglutathione lyase family enzyme
VSIEHGEFADEGGGTLSAAVERPSFTGFHHHASAVKDIGRSASWYERVLGLTRTSRPCPHGEGGEAVLLADPESGVAIRLEETGGTARGHVAFAVSSRSQLDTWANWFDGLGIGHGGVIDVTEPEAYAYLVFHDPDDIPLVLVHTAG